MTAVTELIKKALIAAGAKRVAARTELECSMLESDFGNEVIISAIYNYPRSSSYLVKIVPASKAYLFFKGCEALKYTPYGLYALIQGDSDINKIVSKVRKILKLINVWK